MAHRDRDYNMDRFWQAVKAMQDTRRQALIIPELAPRLSQEQLKEAVDLALTFSPFKRSIDILQYLLPLQSSASNDDLLARMLPVEWDESELPVLFTNLQQKYSW